MNIKGVYDLHVHGGPEPIPRKYDFISLSLEMERAGMAGFIAKSHFYPTAPFAALADAYGAKTVWGSLTLNHFVGGINPNAVRAGLGLTRDGLPLMRIVWMPTMHAASNLKMLKKKGLEYDIPPEWTNGVAAAGRQRIENIEPIDILSPAVADKLKETLDVIASAQICLATGHVSKDELFHLVPLAKERGVRCIVVTHPMYHATNLTTEEMREITQYEQVYAEMSYALLPIDGFTIEQAAAPIRALGAKRVLLTTDLGQRPQLPPYEGMQLFLDMLGSAGFTDEELTTMAVTNPKAILGVRD